MSIYNEEPHKQIPMMDTAMMVKSQQEGTTEQYIDQKKSELHREFKPRQVSMIAIAGAIGTGLMIGSGTGLARGGPGSLFIAYSIIGTVDFFVMSALAEMATYLPMDKGFSGYATRMVDPALGYVPSPFVNLPHTFPRFSIPSPFVNAILLQHPTFK